MLKILFGDEIVHKTMINKLLTEHDHIRRTLNLLEIQFLDMCRNIKPDFSMMRSIVVYIQEYPEQAHHPLEDMIYAILLERKVKVELLQKLITDHTELEQVTRNLRECVESHLQGDCSEEKLKQILSKFLIRQRQHLYTEEMEIYPVAQRILTKKDWEKVQSAAPQGSDPVFGERTRNDYQLLYREIEGNSK
jgi:hemerythrin-like domain-containing protein